jgi:hypothetical protein
MGTIGKWATGVVVLLLVVSGAVVVVQHLKRDSEIKAKLEEAIGRDAGYTETILKLESDSSHITFGEFFSLCDKSVEERTNLIVELRGLYPSVNNATKENLIDFLNAENDAVRSKRDLYRRKMQLSSAMDTFTEAVRDRPSSEYAWDYYREHVARVRREVSDAAKELQGSAAGYAESYQKSLKLEAAVAQSASQLGVRFKPIFKQFDVSNATQGKEAGDFATQVLAKL